MASLRELLETTPVEVSSAPILTVCTTDTVSGVFAALVRTGVLSAPVWKPEHGYVGIIDLLDLLMLFMEVFSRQELETLCSIEAFENIHFTKEQFNRYFKNHTRFIQAAHVDDMAGLSGVNPFVPVPEGSSLWTILSLMVERHLHRIPVMRSERELCNYVTQSRIVQYIHDNISLVDESVRSKTVGEIGIGIQDNVVTARDTDRAIDVFAVMSHHGFSAIPIVNEEQQFVGVLSASDIKGIGCDCTLFPRLSLTVLDYIAPIRQQNFKARHPAIGCHPSDSMERVINKLVATRVHRLVLTEPTTQRVLGIISLTDVLRYLHSACQ